MPALVKNAVPSAAIHQHPQRAENLVRLTVEDEVDTGELLPRLDEDTGEGTEGDLVVAGLEAVSVAGLAKLLLLLEVGADVVELDLDLGVGGVEGREAGERLGSILIAALLDQETGRLWAQR